jgi:pimeloyl-ACP methyl ester carboxylesterase
VSTGYAPVNGVDVYWESRGEGGPALLAVHGGYGLASTFDELLSGLAEHRRVVAIELQGHGHTRDIDRAFSFAGLGDEIAGVIDHLGLGPVDLLGYSLGGEASLRAAIQHPTRVRRLVLVSIAFRRDGWFPEIRAAFDQMSRAGFPQLGQSPLHRAWRAVAPDPGAFPALMDKTGDLLRQHYDWTEEVRQLAAPTLLVYGDADSIPPAHAAEFFALLGGGLQDAGWDGALPSASRLAILPGRTHYDIIGAPQLPGVLAQFLA